jgi:hypothetical protein
MMKTKTTDLSRLLNREISRLGEMPDDELTRLCVMLERAFTHSLIERELRDKESVSQPSLAVVSG